MKILLKKIFLCFLAAIMLVASVGCKDDKVSENKKSESSEEISSIFEPTIDDGSGNIDPSLNDTNSNDNNFATDISVPDEDKNTNNYPDYTKIYGVSALAKEEELQFYYQGMTYAYGITKAGHEVIALIDQNNGDFIDVMSGAGKMILKNNNNLELITVDGIDNYERSMSDGFMRLDVYYELGGIVADTSELVTTYIFKESTINISQHISYKSDRYEAIAEKSYIQRIVNLDYKLEEASVVGKWIYPSNGDYPYQVSESVATVLKFDENHSLYTFVKAVEENMTIYPEEYPELNIPLSFDDGKGVNYTVEYDLVMATTNGSVKDNYHSLFCGRGSDYAVGVFPVSQNSENSTVFVGNHVDLNLNVTNLISSDVNFSLRYDIRDYYGNIVDSGLFVNNTVLAGTSIDRKIRIKGKYGMYYLNLYSVSSLYTHLECYPLALIPTSDYKYRSTNPFGMTSIADNGVEDDAITAAKLNVKIGTGNYRVVANASGYQLVAARYMHQNGIKLNAQLNMNNIKPTGYKSVGELVKAIQENVAEIVNITDSIEVGNEINYSYSEGLEANPSDYAKRYLEDMYAPSSEAVRAAGFKYACAGVSACDRVWLNDVLGKTKSTWDLMDILSVHPYGFPCMPDIYGNGTYSNKWNYERSLMLVMDAFKKNGSKEWYISETGYPTSPAKATQVSLRTQADYDMRILVLGHSYGASRIQLYCFYDRRSFGNGYDIDDTEMGYGIFYQPDFLGVVKPKPVAAAFAAINSVTDGVLKTEEYTKYTRTDGTLRAFKMTVKDSDDLYVVWSNKYPLSNAVVGNQTDRIPAMPWMNQWNGRSEDVTFDAVSSKVYVTDIMGNMTTYTAKNGKVTIPVSGSLLYIRGIK